MRKNTKIIIITFIFTILIGTSSWYLGKNYKNFFPKKSNIEVEISHNTPKDKEVIIENIDRSLDTNLIEVRYGDFDEKADLIRVGGSYFKKKSDLINLGNGYFKDKNNIYFYTQNWIEHVLSKISDIDAKTFQVINDKFAKDKNNIYYTFHDKTSGERFVVSIDWSNTDNGEIYNLDSETFEDLGEEYIKDKNYAFSMDVNYSKKRVELNKLYWKTDSGEIYNLDGATFEHLAQEYGIGYMKDKNYAFSKTYDKNHNLTLKKLYWNADNGEIYNLDGATFEYLGYDYMKDKNYVFLGKANVIYDSDIQERFISEIILKKIEGISPNDLSIGKNGLFFQGVPILTGKFKGNLCILDMCIPPFLLKVEDPSNQLYEGYIGSQYDYYRYHEGGDGFTYIISHDLSYIAKFVSTSFSGYLESSIKEFQNIYIKKTETPTICQGNNITQSVIDTSGKKIDDFYFNGFPKSHIQVGNINFQLSVDFSFSAKGPDNYSLKPQYKYIGQMLEDTDAIEESIYNHIRETKEFYPGYYFYLKEFPDILFLYTTDEKKYSPRVVYLGTDEKWLGENIMENGDFTNLELTNKIIGHFGTGEIASFAIMSEEQVLNNSPPLKEVLKQDLPVFKVEKLDINGYYLVYPKKPYSIQERDACTG